LSFFAHPNLNKQREEITAVTQAAAELKEGRTEPASYLVHVDPRFRLFRIAKMVKAGRYANQGNAISAFREGSYTAKYGRPYTKEVLLISPSRDEMRTGRWEAELEAAGWKNEGLLELLALGAQYPNLQYECDIVALGGKWVVVEESGYFEIAILRSWGGERLAESRTIYPETEWTRRHCALVSRIRR
jgi:hypothetical protein